MTELVQSLAEVAAKLEEAPYGAEAALGWYCRYPRRFCRAQAVQLMVDGREAFPEMLEGLGKARYTIELETYILADDHTGRSFQHALIEAAGRGVKVRLIYDWLGSYQLPESFVRELIEGGVRVAVFHPLVLTRPSRAINRRNHRKIIIIDHKVSFTGGINLCDSQAPEEDGGSGWRDTHIRIMGRETARQFLLLFEYGWKIAKPFTPVTGRGKQLKIGLGQNLRNRLSRRTSLRVKRRLARGRDGVAVQVIGNEEFRYRYRINRAYISAIKRARHYIFIENAYFIPNRPVRRALAGAVRRGVRVVVAVNRAGDHPICVWAGRHTYKELLEAGVKILEWPEMGMLHAKTAVIDDIWAIVGSYNFDHRSLIHSLEAVAIIVDPVFGKHLREQTLRDFSQAREIRLAEHNARPWHVKLRDYLAWQFHYWL